MVDTPLGATALNYRPFTVYDAIRGVNRRKKLVIAFFVLTCLVVGVATLLTPKSYKSEARLFMRLGRENTSLDATATLGEHPVVMMPQSREAEINSIVELIQSKQLYEKVVDSLEPQRILNRKWRPSTEGGPEVPSMLGSLMGSVMDMFAYIGLVNDLPARERAVIKLQKNIEIEAFEKSNVLTVSFVSYSPELAQEVVDRLVGFYQTQHVNLHRPPQAFEFLERETQRIEEELTKARLALECFKNETGILESGQQRTILIDRIAKLKQDLLIAETNEAVLRTEVDQLKKGLSQMSEKITMSETVGAGNEGADGMRQELFRLEVQREQMAAKFTANHPSTKRIEEQLQQAKSLLEAEESKRRESIVGPNRIYQETAVALEQKKPMLAAEETKVKKLREQIVELTGTLHDFTANERKFAELERNVDVLEGNYRKYFTNLEQARIDTKMKTQEFSNIGVAQPATLNLKPHSPSNLINFSIAVFLGAAGGIGLAVFLEFVQASKQNEPSSSEPNDLRKKVIARIPTLSNEELNRVNRLAREIERC